MSIYKINKDTNIPSNAPTYVQPGIHENMVMVDLKYQELESGSEFLGFYFEDTDGNKLSYTEWPKNFDKPVETMSPEEKEKYMQKIEDQMNMLRQFIESFLGRELKEEEIIEANSFKELANNVIKFIGDYKDKPVRIKAAYDLKGWVTIPKTPWNRVIESMNISKEDSEIKITPFDKMERPQKDIEQKTENPFSDEDINKKEDTENLPF